MLKGHVNSRYGSINKKQYRFSWTLRDARNPKCGWEAVFISQADYCGGMRIPTKIAMLKEKYLSFVHAVAAAL